MPEDLIEWAGPVGKLDWSDICTKRVFWFIKLDNGQDCQVAETRVLVNPFPAHGESHLCDSRYMISRPGLWSKPEYEAFQEAVFSAGKWFGECCQMATKKDKGK